MLNIVHLNTLNFEQEVINEKRLVLVDFWADWCAPCKAMEPMINEIANQMKNKVKVAKVNVETDGEIANRFSIRGIPTFLLFKNGEVIDQIASGTIKKEQFIEIINQYLAS